MAHFKFKKKNIQKKLFTNSKKKIEPFININIKKNYYQKYKFYIYKKIYHIEVTVCINFVFLREASLYAMFVSLAVS